MHESADVRWLDVTGNYLFILLFTGVLIHLLVRQLDIERDKSDGLLLNILPRSVAEELRFNDRVAPRAYENTTVIFTDFVGFIKIAEQLAPDELVAELDECFRVFDRIIRQHHL